jgi:ABC-type uncharacterized transport system involved in gliding motility auxiliary subunit
VEAVMETGFRFGLLLLVGLALLGTGLAIHAILLEPVLWTALLAGAGGLLAAGGAYGLRAELRTWLRRRGAIALYTLGVLGVLTALAYLTVCFSFRFDMTKAGLYSLSRQTRTVLERLESPVRIVFFYDQGMREARELLELYARHSAKFTVEFYDPSVNPAQARLHGVQFAGTSVMESAGRVIKVNGGTETDFTNGILRITKGVTKRLCFLDGHGEADVFSLQTHDHFEGQVGHTHGIGVKYELHERHGLGKARNALETINYRVEHVRLVGGQPVPGDCVALVVAGPRLALLPAEVQAVEAYLAQGGNAFFMLDPWVDTGLERVIAGYGVVLNSDMVIDEASHFWNDISSPAVTSYTRHEVTRELPLTFFPGIRSLSPTRDRVPGTTVMPLFHSSRNSYGVTDPARAEFDAARDRRGPLPLMVVVRKRLEDADSSAPTAAGNPPASHRAAKDGVPEDEALAKAPKRQTRIAVIGDSDFATNSFFHSLGNGDLFLNTINYLTEQTDLIGIEPRTYNPPQLTLTNRQMKGTFFLSVILMPAVLAVIGTAVWWKQR